MTGTALWWSASDTLTTCHVRTESSQEAPREWRPPPERPRSEPTGECGSPGHLAWPVPVCTVSGELLYTSEPQFPHVSLKGEDASLIPLSSKLCSLTLPRKPDPHVTWPLPGCPSFTLVDRDCPTSTKQAGKGTLPSLLARRGESAVMHLRQLGAGLSVVLTAVTPGLPDERCDHVPDNSTAAPVPELPAARQIGSHMTSFRASLLLRTRGESAFPQHRAVGGEHSPCTSGPPYLATGRRKVGVVDRRGRTPRETDDSKMHFPCVTPTF